MLGELRPKSGSAIQHPQARVGTFAQSNVEDLVQHKGHLTSLKHMKALFPDGETLPHECRPSGIAFVGGMQPIVWRSQFYKAQHSISSSPTTKIAILPACRAKQSLAHCAGSIFLKWPSKHLQCMSCMEVSLERTLSACITLEHQAWMASRSTVTVCPQPRSRSSEAIWAPLASRAPWQPAG